MDTTEQTPAQRVQAWAEAHKVTMTAAFIPYSIAQAKRPDWFTDHSQNRPGGRPWRGLTWSVTILRDGREVLTTDYSAGEGHCPSYEQPGFRSGFTMEVEARIAWECEHGYPAASFGGGTGSPMRKPNAKPLLPDLADVLYSLSGDADAIDHPTFESWAGDFGYDVDSRKAESIYRACLEIGLKLRAAFGDSGLSSLREALQDF